MSDVIEQAVSVLNEKLSGGAFDGTAKFVVEGEGAIMLDSSGARSGDEDAEVTMIADAETFSGILDGSVDPTGAFMTGRLKVEGDMGAAMKLAPALA